MSHSKKEAKFSLESTMLVQSIENVATAPLPLAPLVTFDLNFDTLRDFLNNVAVAINQQSTFIKVISKEVQNKLNNNEIHDVLNSLTNSFRSDFVSKKSKSLN